MITLPQSGSPDDALCERLDAALDAERAALLSGKEEDLSHAEREKALLLDGLLGTDRTVMRPADSVAPGRLHVLASKNRLNGQLIAARLAAVQRRREFLDGFTGRACTYGPDGVTHPHSRPTLSSRI